MSKKLFKSDWIILGILVLFLLTLVGLDDSEETNTNSAPTAASAPKNGYDWQQLSMPNQNSYCKALIKITWRGGTCTSKVMRELVDLFANTISIYYGSHPKSDSIEKAVGWAWLDVRDNLNYFCK